MSRKKILFWHTESGSTKHIGVSDLFTEESGDKFLSVDAFEELLKSPLIKDPVRFSKTDEIKKFRDKEAVAAKHRPNADEPVDAGGDAEILAPRRVDEKPAPKPQESAQEPDVDAVASEIEALDARYQKAIEEYRAIMPNPYGRRMAREWSGKEIGLDPNASSDVLNMFGGAKTLEQAKKNIKRFLDKDNEATEIKKQIDELKGSGWDNSGWQRD